MFGRILKVEVGIQKHRIGSIFNIVPSLELFDSKSTRVLLSSLIRETCESVDWPEDGE